MRFLCGFSQALRKGRLCGGHLRDQGTANRSPWVPFQIFNLKSAVGKANQYSQREYCLALWTLLTPSWSKGVPTPLDIPHGLGCSAIVISQKRKTPIIVTQPRGYQGPERCRFKFSI
jgi:hypothetical protein